MSDVPTRQLETVELRFKKPGRPVSTNDRLHWAEQRRLLQPWQEAVRAAWSQTVGKNRFANVPCRVEVTIPLDRKRRADPSNYTGTVVKAIVDVLQRACGAWPDDSPEWVQIVDPVLTVGDDVIVKLIPRIAESEALGSRAVLRSIEPGNQATCAGCGARLTFTAWKERKTRQQVICNVYENARWNRVEHWHPPCYKEAGEPYGKATA